MAKKSSKSQPAKKKTGRPTKFEESMIEQAEEFLAQGYNRKALAAELDISLETLDRWRKENERFREAVQRGMAKSERWFINQLRSGFFSETIYDRTKGTSESKTMNGNVVSLYARNVYGWDKKEEKKESNPTINISYDPKAIKKSEDD